MSYALITKLRAAKSSGADPRLLVEEWLHERYRSTHWILIVLLAVMFVIAMFVGAAVMALALKSELNTVPLLGSLAQMDEDSLHWVIGLSIGIIVPLITVLMQVRNGRHKNFAALLLMTAGCDVVEVIKVTFDGKEGKASVMLEVLSSVVGAG
ncbi:MAG: hypothetical protein Q8R02_04345 [Hyphomonadaceae bacterium]|nr:hypothetical protein [Hyphomonadaceae bacterium]